MTTEYTVRPGSNGPITINWSDDMAELVDTISTSSWSVVSGAVTLASATNTTTTTTVRVNAGACAHGDSATIRCGIVTAAGTTDYEIVIIYVRD